MRETPVWFPVEVILSNLQTTSHCWANSSLPLSELGKWVACKIKAKNSSHWRWEFLPSTITSVMTYLRSRVGMSHSCKLIQQNLTVQSAELGEFSQLYLTIPHLFDYSHLTYIMTKKLLTFDHLINQLRMRGNSRTSIWRSQREIYCS